MSLTARCSTAISAALTSTERASKSQSSLGLKTAKRGKALHSLEANLRVGNSLITVADGGAEFSPRIAYKPQFESCKTYFPEFALRAQISRESPPFNCGGECYFALNATHAEIALFNSKNAVVFLARFINVDQERLARAAR